MGCAFNYERLELVELDLKAYKYQKIMHKKCVKLLLVVRRIKVYNCADCSSFGHNTTYKTLNSTGQ